MREVRIGALCSMKSPIRVVMEHIHEALVRIAPEREDEFRRTFDEFILEYLDDRNWVCQVDTDKKVICVSRKVVEVLWAASMAYSRLWNKINEQRGGRTMMPLDLDLDKDTYLRDGMELLQWALNSWLKNGDDNWPHHLPGPVRKPNTKSDEYVAQELALCAAAFMIHHELAHVRFCHRGASLDLEREADQAAADWVLGRLDNEDDAMFVKRSWGMAVALGILVAGSIHTGMYDGMSHPRAYDRLLSTLDRHIRNPNHPAWWFTVAILKLHLDNASHGACIPNRAFGSVRECADAYVDALSRVS